MYKRCIEGQWTPLKNKGEWDFTGGPVVITLLTHTRIRKGKVVKSLYHIAGLTSVKEIEGSTG